MDLDFWHQRWQANLTGFHQDEINTHLLRYWPRLQLATDSRVLVPLCGKSLDMLWLLEQGHAVVGVEVSQIAVEHFFEENDLSPEIHEEHYGRRYTVEPFELLCADFFCLTQSDIGSIDAFYDRAALVALAAVQRPRYATQLTQLLGGGTSGLLVTLEYPQSEMDGPPFSVPVDEVYRLFQPEFTLDPLFQCNVLEENQKFREKGLTQLTEHAYLLRHEQTS
jgi:thiopurine S-methyltransferase